MANFDPTFFTALVSLITSTWTDVTKVSRSTSIDRDNLEKQIRDASLTLPLAVVHVGDRAEDGEWGLNNVCYRFPVSIYYLAAVDTTTTSSVFEAKMASLRDALIAYAGGAFQVIEYPSVYVESTNDVNSIFYGLGHFMYAGEIYCELLVGETL